MASSFNFEDFEEPAFPEEEMIPQPEFEERGPRGRRFLIIAGLLALIFCLGVALVSFLLLRMRGPTDAELTITTVLQTNTAVAVAIAATQTADAYTDTPTPTFTPTDTPTPTATFTPTDTATPTATLTATPDLNATLTAIAIQTLLGVTLTPLPTTEALLSDINLTQTALAATLAALGPTATPEVVGPTPLPTSTALPETGFFDDFASGGGGAGGLAVMGLAALMLVGIIVASRRLRSSGA